MRRILLIVCLIAAVFVACRKSSHPTQTQLLSVQTEQAVSELYYTGTIQPARATVIPSPADGVILDRLVQYGDHVKAGEVLFVLSSPKFSSEYKAALLAYVKAKQDFTTSQSQLDESTFLHKHELISEDDFKSKQASFYATQLGLLQAKDVLTQLMQQLGMQAGDLYQLSINDIDKLTLAMQGQKQAASINIVANSDGVMLSPTRGEDDHKKWVKGDIIKQGDVLAMIGDMQALSVRIKVNELTINQLKMGQAVKVTGVAFPEHTLTGKIATLSAVVLPVATRNSSARPFFRCRRT